MKIPQSWLAEFITFPKNITPSQIAEAFVKVGFEVEGIENPADKIKGPLRIGKVLEIEELTGLKKPIRYVALDCGEKSTRYVICGARNFEVGDLVVVALPGAVLPGDFAISARETYGRMSNGMICSSRELGLGDDHSGIIVVEKSAAKVGANAIDVLEMNDPIIDIAINPDRGYAMSIRGAARELAMSLGRPFVDIDSKKLISNLERKKKRGKIIPAQISDPTGADEIYLRTLRGFTSQAQTPAWMAKRLQQCGMRPISLAVDITNYVMLELGQPLHAFDGDLITGTLRVQRAGKYKSITTLDNQKRALHKDDLLICDDKKPLALAGTMGGLDSEVTEKTETIALEAAHFDSVSIARNSRRHILSSEASRRFERGVDPVLAEIASARAALLLIELGGATYVGSSIKSIKSKLAPFTFDPSAISRLIGATYSNNEIERALRAIGGQIEVHNYPFVSAQQMELFGFTGDRAKTFEIANPMSEEFPYLRTHLTPGLVSAAARNLARGERSVALFESGLVFRNTEKLMPARDISVEKKPSAAQVKRIYESVPRQALHIAGVIAGEIENSGWWGKGRRAEWSDAIDIVRELLDEIITDYSVKNVELAPWHPGRCAEFTVAGKPIAHAGELHPRITSALGLPERTIAFALVLDAIPVAAQVSALPVSTLPAAIQDISLFVPSSVTAAEVEAALRAGAGPLLESVKLFDRFQREGEDQISLAFTLTFRASDRTLTSEEVSQLREEAGLSATKKCGATIRS
ncbi:MAG: phenylalanine--tRNA ligase subunit beta [Actinobacteria bacterium]|nr:phenylalanine--tRNA ligase subunit beta [Actinomycetota bacterium]